MLKKMLHSSFVLAVTCGICMFCVSLIYKVTFDDIEYKNNQKKQAALSIILGDLEIDPIAQTFSQDDTTYEIYLGRDQKTKEIQGWGVLTSIQGYSSLIQTLVGIDKDYNIIAMEILLQQETPGLGAECVSTGQKKLSSLWSQDKPVKKRPWFQDQFTGLNLESMDFKIITGATITSTAIRQSVAKGIEIVKNYRNCIKK